eukprot:scaffold102279_cov63-Phaeocystis_antarctica.AAC.4
MFARCDAWQFILSGYAATTRRSRTASATNFATSASASALPLKYFSVVTRPSAMPPSSSPCLKSTTNCPLPTRWKCVVPPTSPSSAGTTVLTRPCRGPAAADAASPPSPSPSPPLLPSPARLTAVHAIGLLTIGRHEKRSGWAAASVSQADPMATSARSRKPQ